MTRQQNDGTDCASRDTRKDPALYLVRFQMPNWRIQSFEDGVNGERAERAARQHHDSWAQQVTARPEEEAVACGIESDGGIIIWAFAYSRLREKTIQETWIRETGASASNSLVQYVSRDLIGLAKLALTFLPEGDPND